LPAKQARFADRRVALALQQADPGTPVTEVRRGTETAEQTFYGWNKKYGGLMPINGPIPTGEAGAVPPHETDIGPLARRCPVTDSTATLSGTRAASRITNRFSQPPPRPSP